MPRFRFKPWMILAAVLLLLVVAFFGTFFITGSNQPSTAIEGAVGTAATPAVSGANSFTDSVENVVGAAAAPAVSGANSFTDSIVDFFNRLFALRDIDKEYEQQKIRIQQLELSNQLLQDLQLENERLTELLGFKEKYPGFEYLHARVIGKQPGSWFLIFSLNRGANDGVEKQMMVVNELGLVGTVIEVRPTSCKVMAIIDRMSRVSVIVEHSRDNGMAHGAVDPQVAKPSCSIFHLPTDADIVPGDKVVTSDFDGSTIKGIPVGTIMDVSRDRKLQQQAVLIPYVDFSHLENVLIIKRIKQTKDNSTAAPDGTASPDATTAPEGEPSDKQGEGN